ncbi:MAG: divalent metal cation transporter, partial [Pseudomonadales bacterium]|nr:divalent metal cation transporter [Pseudomonadales bacterium]
ITACVVIGPGSILTSSKVGARDGFDLTWIVVLSVIFMMAFMQMGARLGAVLKESPGTVIARRAGRWLAVVIGISIFFIASAFQFGNNLGVDSAFKSYVDFDYIVIVFNALAIGFLFVFKDLYKAIEKLMMCFVGLMLVSFALNLGFALSNMPDVQPIMVRNADEPLLDISLLGLVGTTFVIAAAYYQAYLVQQKGWTRNEIHDGLIDARVGSVLMAVITLMIMCTAAAVLRGKTLGNVDEVAEQLAPLFGDLGKPLFCIGLFSAAYSSFLVNSMIGGFILSDGLGLGNKPSGLAPRLLTAAVLLTGMGVALYVILTGTKPVPAIVAAQAVTVLAAPLIGGVMLWLTNSKEVMGEDTNSLLVNVVGGIGLLLLLAMA